MNRLSTVRQKLREVASDYAIRKAMREILEEHETELEELIKGQMLAGRVAGSRKRERELAPKYSNDLYAQKKQRMNSKPKYRTPDLRLTGDFHDSITVEVKGSKVTFDATDWKKDKLMEKYGAILTLSRERWQQFNKEVLEPKLKAKIMSKIK